VWLIINMPRRSLRSVTASVAFPAFVLAHDPTRRIICISYSGDLAKKHANDFRAVVSRQIATARAIAALRISSR
jgi:hypothetical protein